MRSSGQTCACSFNLLKKAAREDFKNNNLIGIGETNGQLIIARFYFEHLK
jgi:hypothetical protein